MSRDEHVTSGTEPLLGEDISEVEYDSRQSGSTTSKMFVDSIFGRFLSLLFFNSKRLLPVLTVIFGTSFLVAGLIFVAFPSWFWKNSPSQPGSAPANSGDETEVSQEDAQSRDVLASSIIEAMDSAVDPCEDFYR